MTVNRTKPVTVIYTLTTPFVGFAALAIVVLPFILLFVAIGDIGYATEIVKALGWAAVISGTLSLALSVGLVVYRLLRGHQE